MNRISKLRKEKGLTQIGLALKLNVSQKMVSAYENGTHQPGIETLKRMSEIFNVSVDYLIENSDIRMKSDNLSGTGLSTEEADILALFRELDVKNRHRAFGILFALKNYSSLP